MTDSTESGYAKPSCSSSGLRGSLETLTSPEPQSPISMEMDTSVPAETEDVTPSETESVMGKFLRLLPWNNKNTLSVEPPSPLRPSSLRGGLCRSRVASGARSPSSPVRTPVDDFNYSLLESLFQRSTSTTASGVSSTVGGVVSGSSARRDNWVRYFAGARSAQSQDCVAARNKLLEAKGMKLMDTGQWESFSWLNAEEEEITEEKVSRSNTWPFYGMHMNHGELSNLTPLTSTDAGTV